MIGLLELLATLIVAMVFVPVSVWAYERGHAVIYTVTLFVGCTALWLVIMFGVVAVMTAL